ncbi:DUF4062 domain-containing protein [Acinetobacter baumannii]|uniref:DUF4062 domain-containing protein n=1 Tax=Acinetobacter baumannii TaxID=470 RepID=UPI001CE183E8|nr:DUF4062 domain-containing protein [Acinetobacter baumannii]UBX41373.1 DUF4062 domain-containing protein [Acinetobacter baumannii]
MSSAKKYQVFISSTYTDLLDERQAAVEAILQAGHIPAGMELFTSSNQSQWDIIKRWIDESDIYMLILGGRYGSIETKSGKSYTHLEYEYALSKNKPLFVIVIKDEALNKKTVAQVESQNPEKLKKFRKKVLNSMCEFFLDTKDIQLAVHKCLGKVIQDNELIGWVRGNQQNEGLASELVRLNEENRKLREENDEFKRNQQIRLPKLTVEVNDGHPLILKYQEYKALHYQKRESIVWSNVDEALKGFLTAEEIEQYNQQLLEITEEKIKEFDRLNNLKGIFENGMQPIKFKVSNDGNLKANQVYITIKFPSFIYVEEINRDKERLDLIEKLEKKALEVIQNPFWNPVNEAQEKLQKKRAEALNPLYGISKFSLGGAIGRTNSMDIFKAMPTPKFPNIHGDHDYLDSSKRVVIEMGNLLHTLSQNYQDYYIFALERGEGNITVTLHCEEYSNEETIEIPIIVN